MKQVFALLLCTVTLHCFGQKPAAADDPRFKGLDTAFKRVLKSWHAAGFAVAVVQKNKVIYSKGFGYRNAESKLPVTPNTLFAIGSCTKAFTASMVGKLQDEGKLDIDKPVRDYLPSLKFYNDAMNNTITLRDMMSHRTGLPRHDLSWYFFNTKSVDTLMQRIQYQEPTYGVRQKWQYNNFMFAAQGAVIEKLTGKSWEDNIKQNLFVPLGMSRSDLNIPDLLKTDDIAAGYDVRKDSVIHKMDYYYINGMAPAGAINSSANDMAKWVTAWINNGKYEGKQVIPAQHRDNAISSQSIVDGSLPRKEEPGIYFANYGFGWFLSSYKGHYFVEHGGNIDGFTASTCFFPSDSLGIVVLANQNSSIVPTIVRNLISDRLLGLNYHDWNSQYKNQEKKNRAGEEKLKKDKKDTVKHNPLTHPLVSYAGTYSNPGYGSMKVYVENDSLFLKATTHTLWLRHANYDIFDLFDKDPQEGIDTSEVGNVKIQFQMDLAGDIGRLESKLEDALNPIVFTRQIDAKALTETELKKYVGEYELGGLTVKVYIKDAKTLYVYVPGQPDYELVAMGNDKFSVKVLSGYYLQFGPPGLPAVTEVTFTQPNGSVKAKRK